MSALLTVDSVDLRETDEVTESGARVYQFRAAVANASDRPLYASATITNISYNTTARTLHIGLGPLDVAGWPFLSQRRPTSYIEVAPGAHVMIEDRVVSPIEYVEETAPGVVQSRAIAIHPDVDEIECAVSFTDEAPPTVIDLTSSTPTRDVVRHVVHGSWVRPDGP